MKRVYLHIIASICVALLWQSKIVGQSTKTTDVIRMLQSEDPHQRAAAFSMAVNSKEVMGSSSMPNTLIDLLNRENTLIVATLRESKGQDGISVKYGEAFATYYGELLDVCYQRCDRKNPRLVTVLVNSAYSSSSPFAKDLIKEFGRALISPLLEKARNDVGNIRMSAIRMLGEFMMLAPGLTSAEKAPIHDAIVSAARDSDPGVRFSAVEMIGNVGDSRDKELLERIAAGDAAAAPGPRGKTSFPVREEAQRSLAKIAQRNR